MFTISVDRARRIMKPKGGSTRRDHHFERMDRLAEKKAQGHK